MGRLSLILLGQPSARHDGEPVVLATRKAWALLAYLAAEGGIHARDKLTALFWPESDGKHGRAALRKTLAYVRQGLGADHLLAERDLLSFEPSGAVVDLWTLRDGFRAEREAVPTAQTTEHLQRLAAAANVAAGEFLDGFSLPDAPDFDDWVLAQREVSHRQAIAVFERLSQALFETGDAAGALQVTTRWVGRDPLNELAHRRLMQLYFAMGNRAAALQAYEACRSLLQRELHAEPAAETEALAERVRRQPPPA